jgi:heme exporter protein CcmD
MSDHTNFIVAAYAIAVFVVGALIVSIILQHRALKAALAKLPTRDLDDAL